MKLIINWELNCVQFLDLRDNTEARQIWITLSSDAVNHGTMQKHLYLSWRTRCFWMNPRLSFSITPTKKPLKPFSFGLLLHIDEPHIHTLTIEVAYSSLQSTKIQTWFVIILFVFPFTLCYFIYYNCLKKIIVAFTHLLFSGRRKTVHFLCLNINYNKISAKIEREKGSEWEIPRRLKKGSN